MIKMVGDAYMKAKPDTVIKSPHVGMAASNTYLFLSDVLPRAIKKYGGISADALRQGGARHRSPRRRHDAGLRRQVRGPGDRRWPARTTRAFPVVIQYIDDKSYVVWPKSQQQREPVLKLPTSSPYAAELTDCPCWKSPT